MPMSALSSLIIQDLCIEMLCYNKENTFLNFGDTVLSSNVRHYW